MNRTEFETALTDLVRNIVDTDRELTDLDEDNLNDNLGDVAGEIISNAPDDNEADDTDNPVQQ